MTGERRSYDEKQRLVLDLVMLLFGGLFRLLQRRKDNPEPKE